jgi:hypothetical protein
MFGHSIIRTTGQWWKVLLFCSTVLSGGILLFWGVIEMQVSDPPAHSFLLAVVGLLLGFFGFVFALTAVYCPACRTRWVWLAVRQQNTGQWLRWLLSQTECPVCKKARA